MNLDRCRTYLLYFGWRTRRSTRTTTVFCILSLVTRPTFSWRRLAFLTASPASATFPETGSVRSARSAASDSLFSSIPVHPERLCAPLLLIALGYYRLYTSQVFALPPQFLDHIRVPERKLEPEPEESLLQLAYLFPKLLVSQLPDLFRLHTNPPSTASLRETNLVFIGSLFAASLIASRAVFSSTPSISNRTRPGFPPAPQPSGAPLPFPIRVSAVFLVIGLSGNTLIHIFPPRLMNRVIATREASICLLVTHAGSRAF